MTNLITLENISLAYGLDAILDNVNLQVGKHERVCLIGRNGAGKSSLLKIIEGTFTADSGTVWRKPHLRFARLAQDLPSSNALTVYEFVAEGLAATGKLLTEYHALTLDLQSNEKLSQLDKLQHQIEAVNGWQFDQKINQILSRLQLSINKSRNFSGVSRRAAPISSL